MSSTLSSPTLPATLCDVGRERLHALTRTHHVFLRGLARQLCRSGHDAEDLVQDVLLRAVANHNHLPPDVNHAAWMARVMRNLFIDRRRSHRPVAEVDIHTVPAPEADPPAWWEDLSASDIRGALQSLPAELRVAFELHCFEKRSYRQIAEVTGVPISTVGTRILRARRHLRRRLGC